MQVFMETKKVPVIKTSKLKEDLVYLDGKKIWRAKLKLVGMDRKEFLNNQTIII